MPCQGPSDRSQPASREHYGLASDARLEGYTPQQLAALGCSPYLRYLAGRGAGPEADRELRWAYTNASGVEKFVQCRVNWRNLEWVIGRSFGISLE